MILRIYETHVEEYEVEVPEGEDADEYAANIFRDWEIDRSTMPGEMVAEWCVDADYARVS